MPNMDSRHIIPMKSRGFANPPSRHYGRAQWVFSPPVQTLPTYTRERDEHPHRRGGSNHNEP